MDVGHGRVLTTCQIRGSPWQRCWEAWESPRWPKEKHREQRQTGRAPGAHTRERGSPQRGRGDSARPRKQKEGSFQPGEELRCKCRKAGLHWNPVF